MGIVLRMILNRAMRLHSIGFVILAWIVCSTSAFAADFTIGYLQLNGDPRYSKKQLYARHLMQPLGRPYTGTKIALQEVKFHGAAVDAQFKVKRFKGKNADELIASAKKLHAEGIRFIIVDLPADVVSHLAKATQSLDLVLFNIAAKEDRLRSTECSANVFHIIPSYRMLMDALVQYLVFRKWNKVLVLEGKSEEDKQLAQAFATSAKRYGVKLIDKRVFELSNDPRKRDQNNVALLTSGKNYDVIFVADTQGEFARDVPYQSVKPQLVVGSEGLAAAAWHWSWERHGAPQLERRFEKKAKRPMRDVDWAAWMAVKAIAESVQRTASTEFSVLKQYLQSDALVLDGFKGYRSNFRSWNNQLRQPLLLTTHNWVVERAPIKGFLHQKNNLDTLGVDERGSGCKF